MEGQDGQGPGRQESREGQRVSAGPWFLVELHPSLSYVVYLRTDSDTGAINRAYVAFREHAQGIGFLVDDTTKILQVPTKLAGTRIFCAVRAPNENGESLESVSAKLDTVTGLEVDHITDAGATHPTAAQVGAMAAADKAAGGVLEQGARYVGDALSSVLTGAILILGLSLGIYLLVTSHSSEK